MPPNAETCQPLAPTCLLSLPEPRICRGLLASFLSKLGLRCQRLVKWSASRGPDPCWDLNLEFRLLNVFGLQFLWKIILHRGLLELVGVMDVPIGGVEVAS